MQQNVAYATLACCICNKMLRMRHFGVAYATKWCVCNKFSQKGIFLKIGSWKYFLMFRSWFMRGWTIPNWKETWSNMKIVLVVPRIHSERGLVLLKWKIMWVNVYLRLSLPSLESWDCLQLMATLSSLCLWDPILYACYRKKKVSLTQFTNFNFRILWRGCREAWLTWWCKWRWGFSLHQAKVCHLAGILWDTPHISFQAWTYEERRQISLSPCDWLARNVGGKENEIETNQRQKKRWRIERILLVNIHFLES